MDYATNDARSFERLVVDGHVQLAVCSARLHYKGKKTNQTNAPRACEATGWTLGRRARLASRLTHRIYIKSEVRNRGHTSPAAAAAAVEPSRQLKLTRFG